LARFNPKKLPITHCHYAIRPWLNKSLQRTERVAGYIKAKSRDDGKMFYFGSAYD
jgi:hypothetical protein